MAIQSYETSHALRDYTCLVKELMLHHRDDLPLAMAKAIGSTTLEGYHAEGDRQVAVLEHAGLADGQAIYDLACGSGRTAAALRRRGWQGHYRGADLIGPLVDYARQSNPGFDFFVHRDYSLRAERASLDLVYAWSLFTHLHLEEILLYARDAYDRLKPGGRLVFSALTLESPAHVRLLQDRALMMRRGDRLPHLDTFLARSALATIMEEILQFRLVEWIDAEDTRRGPGPALGQAVAIYRK